VNPQGASGRRLYRFGDPDQTGWLLGLGGPQCLALGAAVCSAGVLLSAGWPLPAVLVPLVIGAVFAFGRVGGVPAYEWLPVSAAFLLRRMVGQATWQARLPLLPSGGFDTGGQPELPPCLERLAIREVPSPVWASSRPGTVAVVEDRHDRTISATLRVRGPGFALLDPAEQDRLIAGWGDSVGGFCAEKHPVAFVRWSEWAAPVGLEDHLRHLDEHRAAPAHSPAVRAYRQLLEEAAPEAMGHEVLLTVTLDTRRLHTGHARRSATENPAVAALLEEVRLLSVRLETAGLAVDPPLSPAELAVALRLRFDPACRQRLAIRRRSLAAQAGLVSLHNAGPLRMVEHKRSFEVDGAIHRAYVVAEWPRYEVPANWLEPLLLHAGGVRTVSVTCFPVSPSRSARQVRRESTRLASDAELRHAKGFRTSARHRRAETAVAEREAELAAGFPELEHLGIVVVTAGDAEALERSCAEWEQTATQAGLELRPLDGRHDLAFAATLPLGHQIPTRRLA
jgi:hypothetical protein